MTILPSEISNEIKDEITTPRVLNENGPLEAVVVASPFVVSQGGSQSPTDKQPRSNSDNIEVVNRVEDSQSENDRNDNIISESNDSLNTRRSDTSDFLEDKTVNEGNDDDITTEYKSILMTVFRKIPIEDIVTTTRRTTTWRTEKPVPSTTVQQNAATTQRKTTLRASTTSKRTKTPSYADAKYVYHTTTPSSIYSFINFR